MRTKKVAAFAGMAAVLAGSGTSVAHAQTVDATTGTHVEAETKTTSASKNPRTKGSSVVFAAKKAFVYKNVKGQLVPVDKVESDFTKWSTFQPAASGDAEAYGRKNISKIKKPDFRKYSAKSRKCADGYYPGQNGSTFRPVSLFDNKGNRVFGDYWVASCGTLTKAAIVKNNVPAKVRYATFEESKASFKEGVDFSNLKTYFVLNMMGGKLAYYWDEINWTGKEGTEIALEDSFIVTSSSLPNKKSRIVGLTEPLRSEFPKKVGFYGFRTFEDDGSVSDLSYADRKVVKIN